LLEKFYHRQSGGIPPAWIVQILEGVRAMMLKDREVTTDDDLEVFFVLLDKIPDEKLAEIFSQKEFVWDEKETKARQQEALKELDSIETLSRVLIQASFGQAGYHEERYKINDLEDIVPMLKEIADKAIKAYSVIDSLC